MDLPENLLISCNQFRLKLNQLKLACSDFLKNYDKLRENAKNNALEEARLDLTLLFTLNSLFWVYLTCRGVDPRKHDIKKEIDRIKNLMIRLNQIKDAAKEESKKPRIDIKATQRFVNSALFDPQNNGHTTSEEMNECNSIKKQRTK